MNLQLVTIAALLIWLGVAAYVPNLFNMGGRGAWLLRIGLWILGLVAATCVILWLKRREAKKKPNSEDRPAKDLDFLAREASQKLPSAKFGRPAALGSFPLLFVIGPQQSGKSTTIVNSGLDVELLSGLVHQVNRVMPTETANFWLAVNTVLIEAGHAVWGDDAAWTRFCQHFRPPSLSAAAAKLGSRGVLICISVKDLVASGGGDALTASARMINDRLNLLAKVLGVRLPVYVAFTKSNLLKYFEDYASNFTNDEALGPFGAALPIIASGSAGGYLDFETRRLNEGFKNLFTALSEQRLVMLDREENPAKLSQIYQFPREFRKLQETVVRFLVELGRPKQTQVCIYLRGFYFTGVRPVSMVDPNGQTRRLPQWVFLTRFFKDVLFADRTALSTSTTSHKTKVIQRVLLGAATLCGLIMIGGWTISYFNNRDLQSRALEAARALGAAHGGSSLDCPTLASTDSLQRLDNVRAILQELRADRDERPLMDRWWLYVGDRLYPEIRSVYFNGLSNVLLKGTKEAIVSYLNQRPTVAGVNDEYTGPYYALRAYLITTSNPDKSSPPLSQTLQAFWHGACPVDDNRKKLVALQMDFYAEELKDYDPFPRASDPAVTEHARGYLNSMRGQQRVYQTLLNEANRKVPSIVFNRIYPGTEAAVLNGKEVPGAFTKDGWTIVQNGLRDARKLFEGESWVLGPGGAQGIDFASLEPQVRNRYVTDYIQQWKDYLGQTQIRHYTTSANAADKLKKFAEPRSPLLAAIYLASKHTAVDDETVRATFRPVQTVVDPKSDNYKWIGANNQPYMKALTGLQAQLEQLSHTPESAWDPIAAACRIDVATAKSAAVAFAQQAGSDVGNLADTVVNLMEAPIKSAEPFCEHSPDAVNAAGKQFCGKIVALWEKYPFNPAGRSASVNEFMAVFQRPNGDLWRYYQDNLSKLLVEQNGVFQANPASTLTVRQPFVTWFNRMMGLSTSLTPQFTFTVQAHEGEGLKTTRLMIGGQGGPITSTPRKFNWPGESGRGVEWTLEDSPTPQPYGGDWGVFDWFKDAEWHARSATSYTVTWTLTLGGRPRQGPDGRPLRAHLDVDMPIPFFQNGYLRQLGCDSRVAQMAN
jgi:type VI secretion system protein ImpL